MHGNTVKRGLIWGIPLVVIAAVIAVVFSNAGAPNDLMARATRVKNYSIAPDKQTSGCRWVSPTTAVILDRSGLLTTVDVLSGGVWARPATYKDVFHTEWMYSFQADYSGGPGVLTFVRKDGSHPFKMRLFAAPTLAWQPDRCAMIEFVHQGDTPNFTTVDLAAHRVVRASIRPVAQERIHCFIGPDSILTSDHSNMTFFNIDLKRGTRTALPWNRPERSRFTEVHASPQYDRLLWYFALDQRKSSWFEQLLFRFGLKKPPPVPPTPYQAEGIWISRTDGSDMRELGEVPGDWAPKGFCLPRWMPDGKHISFLYNYGMYIVSAD